MAYNGASDKKKNRLSFFGRKKDDRDPPSDERLETSPSNNADSAYASSEGPSNAGDSTRPDIISLENHGQISGVSADRNIGLTRAGNVVDEDTGEVIITTVTTTTTTTTKVGGKKGTQVEVSTHGGGQPATGAIVEAPGDRPRSSQHQRAADGFTQSTTTHSQPETAQHQHLSTTDRLRPDAAIEQPSVPSRNPNRKSGDYDQGYPATYDPRYASPSPNAGRHNFSYPSRPDLRDQAARDEYAAGQSQAHGQAPGQGYGQAPGQGYGQAPGQGHGQAARPQSTYENLKAAAVGLHGVGETLRGTINSEVDRRLPRHNAEKQAAVMAHNRAVLEAGNREMAGVMSGKASNNATHPATRNQQTGTGMSGMDSGNAAHPASRNQQTGNAVPGTDSRYPAYPAARNQQTGGGMPKMGPGYTPHSAGPDGDPRNSTYRRPTPEPEPISPIQQNEPVEEKRGIRKLLKRMG